MKLDDVLTTLAPARMKMLRQMKKNEVIFCTLHTTKVPQSQVSALTSKIGGKFEMKTFILLDPVTAAAERVLFVKCVEPANQRKKVGRKKKGTTTNV